ncbi:MAG: ABC transporter ATP-binding protein [Eubacteriales bacterium]|nr:ABC transporter ATP-binding protein [Eubacteriales bacterium]
MIRFKNLTKQYEDGTGIFDFSFEVEEGEVFGLIGSEGSGKTTALRMLMGFESATKGRCAINGKDCRKAALYLHKMIGYLPEEIALPSVMTGRQFLRSHAEMRGIKNMERLFESALRLGLNVDERIGKMSPESLQKTGIVCALMHNPFVLLLDDPFQNLDAGARSALVDIILEEKENRKMILITSSSVDIADLVCDRAALLERGNIVYIADIENMRDNMYRNYLIRFATERAAMQFSKEPFEVKSIKDRNLVVSIQGELLPLIRALSNYHVTSIEPVSLKLEEAFVHIYGGNVHA